MKSKAIKCLVAVSCCIAFFVSQLSAGLGDEFEVWPTYNNQISPDIDGSIVVWQEHVEGEVEVDGELTTVEDWDIYGSDLDDPSGESIMYIDEYVGDQLTPVISGKIVVYSSFDYTDFNIWAADITNSANVDVFGVSIQEVVNEQQPAIHGNTVVWQDDRDGNINIYGADIHNRDYIFDFLVAPYVSDDQIGSDRQMPAIWRNKVVYDTEYYDDNGNFVDFDIMSSDIWLRDNPRELSVCFDEYNQINPVISGDIVVWQDDRSGDMDIYAANISNPDSPVIFEIADIEGQQENPDIDGNIIVWQDNYYGDWDIYGYNLTTGQKFVICEDISTNQKNPVISGNIVAWEDDRDGLLDKYGEVVWQIYAIELEGAQIADCKVKPVGDVNKDCIVNLKDLAILSANWLRDELVISN